MALATYFIAAIQLEPQFTVLAREVFNYIPENDTHCSWWAESYIPNTFSDRILCEFAQLSVFMLTSCHTKMYYAT